MSLRRRN